jgi:hypothetical protein
MLHHEKRQTRKAARTRIYIALYGYGGRNNNQPWSGNRTRPEGWTLTYAQEAIKQNFKLARFDSYRAAIVLHDAGMKIEEVR